MKGGKSDMDIYSHHVMCNFTSQCESYENGPASSDSICMALFKSMLS